MDTKDKIYEAVQAIATEDNIHILTITDIAKAADLARKTIYSYFKSKEEILLDMYAESLTKRYHYAELGIRNLDTMEEKLYKVAQVSFNYYKKDVVSLLIHVYWSNIKIDFQKVDPKIRSNFIKANDHAHDFIINLFDVSQNIEERDFYSIYFLDSIHTIIKRAILEPEFWSYCSSSKEYFDKAIQTFLKGLNNEIQNNI
jgi:AcrR family transcriptional regulator